jgi:hypothetical protein
MLAAADRVAAETSPEVYSEAIEEFAQTREYLSSSEARKMSESDLERELDQRGRELMRKLLQAHLKSRSPGEAAGPVKDAEGLDRPELRLHERSVETTFGTVEIQRAGYAAEGCESLHPLDAALNLPPERYSLEVRRRVAWAAASRSFEESLEDLGRDTGAHIPKRQAEELVFRAAEDFDAFYEARRERAGQAIAEGSVLVLTFDGKGVVMWQEDLREATRKAAQRRRKRRYQLFDRLSKGEKKQSKRMATVGAVYTVEPFVRTPEEFLRSLLPPQPGPTGKLKLVRPRPAAKRVWASLEKEPWEVIEEAILEAERRDPNHSKSWVVVVDGHEHQLELVEEVASLYEVNVTVVLDIIHVAEYVWKAAHAFHPAGSPELECWAWTRVRGILEGKATTVAATMRRAATVGGLSDEKRKPVDTCADYLLKYAPYLRYDRYLAAGYPIASGVIEGACRYLVRDRMERTGARWRMVGAEAVLKIRALKASGDFDEYWTFHEAREYDRNHARHYAVGNVPPVTELPPPETQPRLRRVK